MAYLDKTRTPQAPLPYNPNLPGAPIPISSGGAPAQRQTPPDPEAPKPVAPGLAQAPGSSFPDLTAYLRANRDSAVGMGQQASEGLGAQADQVIENIQGPNGRVGGGDYGGLADIQGKIDSSATDAGRQGLIGDRFGAAPTPGGGRLDAYLVGQVGSAPFNDLRAKYSGLLASVTPQDRAPPFAPGSTNARPPPGEPPKQEPSQDEVDAYERLKRSSNHYSSH